MKNIFEDDTLPSGAEIPAVSVPDRKTSLPVRPKRQVTPPPKQQERQAAQPPYIAVPAQTPAAPQQPMYQYVPVNPQFPDGAQAYPQQGVTYYPVFDQNGQPVYQQPMYPQQIVYPQQVPYVPYGAYPQAPQPAQPTQDAPKEEYDPGTRVLYQSPDFENKDGSGFSDNVGESFAKSVKTSAQDKKDTEEGNPETSGTDSVDFEEVSIDKIKKPVIKRTSAPPIINTQTLSDEDIYKNSETGDISFAAYNAVKPSLDVEEFEQDLPAYEDEDIEEDFGDSGEKKPLSKNEIIRRSVLAVAIVAIVISVSMLLNEWRLSKQNDDVMEEAEDLIITQVPEDDDDDNKDKDNDKTTTKALTPEEQWAEIKATYPNVLFPANIQLKYAKLYGENQDFVGYLSADGVNLNLPVVQTDDDETYLKKNFYGSTTKYGCPFVTHLNNMSYNHLDMNTVIFGHHMNNGTIFGALDKYKTLAGYKSAPVISFNTLYKDYQWKIIGAFITNGYASGDNGYIFPYYFTNLSSASKMSSYLSELAQRSLYDTGVDVLPSDKLLTLSTCSHEFDDARFVVVARLVRPGEKATVDTSRAVVNSKPRYPQAYYSKKGMTNPYKNASRWFAS
jgi:sortase B